jgi:hypothetical protein
MKLSKLLPLLLALALGGCAPVFMVASAANDSPGVRQPNCRDHGPSRPKSCDAPTSPLPAPAPEIRCVSARFGNVVVTRCGVEG